jgi:hypothetical protein
VIIVADIPNEQASPRVSANRRRARLPIRLLPGVLAALLFGALATREAFLGGMAPVVQALLVLGLGVSIAIQPPSVRALRQLRAWTELPHVVAVAVVLALGAGLRFWGIRFGLPYFDHPDEWSVADRALRMVQTADYNPRSFIYPTLYTYMQVGVAIAHFLWGVSAGFYRTLQDIDSAQYYVWARSLTALLGSGAVLLTYVIGRLLYGRAAGLIAALFLAVYPSAVGDAHYITTDTPSMFFTLLSFLLIVLLGLCPPARIRNYLALALLAGLGVGLALATKYNVAVLVLPLALALWFGAGQLQRQTKEEGQTTNDERRTTNDERGANVENGKLRLPTPLPPYPPTPLLLTGGLYALFGIIVAFTIGTPYWISELPLMLNDIASIVIHYKFTGHDGAESSRPALFYWGAFVGEGALLAWLSLGGALLTFLRHRRADVLVLAFAAPYFLQITGVKVVFFRNTMPLLPFLCLLAGMVLVRLWMTDFSFWKSASPSKIQNLKSKMLYVVVVLVAFTIVQPLARTVRENWLRAQPTTRVLATEWVEQNASDGARVWLEDQTLILSQRLRVQGGKPITDNEPEWYRDNGFHYLVVNTDVDNTDAARLEQFGQPIVEFVRDGERYGPNLSVYATGLSDPTNDERMRSGATLSGGALILDGYRHPDETTAGATLPLALYWQVERDLPQDYTVFVHLIDSEGNKVAQRDMPPLDGSLPTSDWEPGSLIRDDQDLALPDTITPGKYQLVVGMYDAQTLAAINDNGPIALGEVTVRAK